MLLLVTDDIGILSFSGLLLLLLFLFSNLLLLLSFLILLFSLSPSVKLPNECKGLVNI